MFTSIRVTTCSLSCTISGAFESSPALAVPGFAAAADLGFGASHPSSPRGMSVCDFVRHTDEPPYQAKTSGVPWTPWRVNQPYPRRPCGDPLNPLHVRWRLTVKVEDPVACLVNQAACRLRRVPGLPRCHRRRHSQQTRNRLPSRPWGCLRRRGRTRWRRGRRSGVWCVFLSLCGSVEWECGTDDAGVSYHSVSRN